MFDLPPGLKWLEETYEGREWLLHLPARVEACVDRCSLRLERPYDRSQASIVFPATTVEGASAVLKIRFPHPECEHEAEALRRWGGQGAVQLLASN
jgi:streptomycin 6-kinase